MKDISGKRSNKLVAIEPTKKKNGSWYWLCKCDCGNFVEVIGASITNGNTNSCGCLSESLISTKLKEYCYKKYSSKSEYNILKNPETGRYLPFDIYIECFKIFIEINGEQHYENSDFWHGKDGLKYNKQKERDKLKKQYAKKNGIYIEIDLRKIKTVEKAIAEVENIIKKYFNKK